MAATLTAFNVALERTWTQKRLEEMLFQNTATLDMIEKTTKYAVGETARVPLHVSRNGGYTVLPDGGGNLNTAGNQGLQKTEYSYTNHHQQVAIQGDVLDRASSSAHAIANVLDVEVNGALNDMRRQLQRQIFGNGDALIAQCRTSDSNDVDLNITSGGNALARGWLFVGQPVDVGTTANEVAIADGRTITAVTESATIPTLTVSGAAVSTEGTTHYVSHQNARAGTTSYEMNGLRNLVATSGTFGTLATSTESSWAAAGVNSTAQPISLSLLMQAQQSVHQKTGAPADWIICGLKQQRKLYEQLQQQIRYSGDSAINAGDPSKVKFQGMTITVDPDCPDEDLYIGSRKHLFIVATDKPYWQNKHSGGEILSWIQGTDSYGAKLTYRINLGSNRRNAFYRFSALS